MPELTAVREVSHNQASDNGGRNLTINDIDNFAALLKGASDRKATAVPIRFCRLWKSLTTRLCRDAESLRMIK